MCYRSILIVLIIKCLINMGSPRVVNISDTWMLPEEGFSVFYRYFRDRISWYEADAVCQFHHGNLVTADSSSQYDAIRAYLKELDISENIWIGLSKTTLGPNFTWKDYQPLSGDGHWEQAQSLDSNPICVAMDPSVDFLWKPTACGGPETFSFICEMPVPSWAIGCLLTELPSLTVLYIPEEGALELTSDCGLDGTKRIICKGDKNREDMLKLLSCDDYERSTKSSIQTDENEHTKIDKTTKSWSWTLDSINTEEQSTRQRRETENTINPSPVLSTLSYEKHENATTKIIETTTDISNISEIFNATNTTDEQTSILPEISISTQNLPKLLQTTQTTTALPKTSSYELYDNITTESDLFYNTTEDNMTEEVILERKEHDDTEGQEEEVPEENDELNETDSDKLFTESEPQPRPRPNRQRILTHSQKRPFYATFFSRVLG